MAESIRTQPERVLDWLNEHPEGITQRDATYELGVTRLAEIIRVIKSMGYEIVDMWETGENRYGQRTRYKRYFLKGEPENV